MTLITTAAASSSDNLNDKKALNPKLSAYIETVKANFSKIPLDRIEELDKIAAFIQKQVNASQPVQLTYICTHNSRRSHFGQIWAAVAGAYYNIPNVKTYSGGTEATAFNERAVAACERAGFEITKTSEGKNPVYHVSYGADTEPVKAFSKKYDEASNPQSDFCAIMTCSQADEACPVVKGSTARVAVPYDDPKAFDGTPQETVKYDERCKQIATETLYVFSKVKI
ncbi:protein-tyrosine-phosphatase [Dyadobacter fanqingshengii]|uniref:Protein-tyrosine-phosphatase n=1 Tax=Dyadobacter fanqingshengii TaxID=2906443 RepID=A0A9X1PCK3_9BACT|nr:protein-tyrosine-phosphatase [Dyadobacter fanqingshengii]MCF0041443.1 protein-tyrosine-phosphatase [Dyadobacter fanqingshengii]USJ36838.1 protein-tyrosine-phosphatase [Dyadobacter fanqingshengii]